MRKTVTIPAAGNKKTVQVTGYSLIIESAGVYRSVNDVPIFSFNSGRANNPIYPRSVYGNDNKEFGSIELTGTAESAGDEVTFYTLNECLNTDININAAQTKKDVVGQTKSYLSSDSAQFLQKYDLLKDGKLPSSIYVSATENDLNYGFVDGGSEPTNNTSWHILTAGAEPIEIKGVDFIFSLYFVNRVAGDNGKLIVTPEY